MNVISSFFDRLPTHWQMLITDKNWFHLSQFNSSVMVHFEDGSHCYFRYAFAVEDKDRKELAVFTEHCGYYIFSTRGLEFEAARREEVKNIHAASDEW
jgi:hypothetical protein